MTASKSKEELAQERLDARAAKDFAKADQLRDQIAALGFEVIDVAGGFEFRAKERFPTYASTRDIKAIKVNGDIAIAMIVDGIYSRCRRNRAHHKSTLPDTNRCAGH